MRTWVQAGVAVIAAAVVWSARPEAASRPPKFVYERIQLPNGLTVVLNQDRSTPIVNVQLWYHVGSKDEKPGRTGFAHLFEHLMFKGSRNVEPEQHTSIVASVGGQANAYTNEDTTVFWQTVPAHFLPLVLWMEGDRMATLRIDQDTFVREREVVKEERRMRIENQPYGRLNEIIYEHAFTTHPYRHPVIGSMEDLNAATIADVRDFYATYYVPSNVTTVDLGRLRRGRSDRPGQSIPRARAEGDQTGSARHPQGAAAEAGEARHRRGAGAAAGGGRRPPHHLRRASGLVSAATSSARCYPTATARGSIRSSSTNRGRRSPHSARPT